jgi:hypothetical protein
MTPDDSAPAAGVPIACTLDAGSLADRVDEWRDLVACSVVSLEAGPNSVRLVLRDSDAALAAAASLGQREKQCCAFFDVCIELGPDSRALVLRVPEGAEAALAVFDDVLSAGSRAERRDAPRP